MLKTSDFSWSNVTLKSVYMNFYFLKAQSRRRAGDFNTK
jgi:hypothetical protein